MFLVRYLSHYGSYSEISTKKKSLTDGKLPSHFHILLNHLLDSATIVAVQIIEGAIGTEQLNLY